MDRDRLNSRIPRQPAYDQMFPYLIYDNPDKANELQALFDKYKRDEIPTHTFIPILKEILGDEQLIFSALAQVQKKTILPGTQINFMMSVVPYDRVFPFLFPEINQDKADELQDLFDKYKREEIHRNTFYSRMKKIVGEELLLSASKKMRDHELQKRNLPVTINEQSRIRLPVVPYEYDQVFPFLFPELHRDKAIEIQDLFDKYKRGEIPNYDFVSLMKGIAGEEKLRSAEAKLKQQKRNLLVPVNEQTRIQINSSEPVLPFDQLFRFLISLIDPDKAIQLQTLFDKYKRGVIGEHTFVPIMKGILGDQMLRSVTAKVKQQKRNPMVPVSKQPRTQINSSELVLPFDQLFPFLISYMDPDKAIELEVLFDKYKRGEIAKHTFESVMKGILGEQMLRLSTAKVEQQVGRVDGLCGVAIRQLNSDFKKRNLPVTVNEQPRTQINFTVPVVPYDQMFPFLFPEIDQGKAGELIDLFDKYKRDEIPRNTFFSLMKDIVGEELLLSASDKMQQLNDQRGTQISFRLPVVPYDQMFPFLFPEIHKEKADEIQALFDKYKRGEIPKYDFVSLLKGIAGEEKLRSVRAKMKQQRINLLVPVNEQPRTQINSSELVLPFDQLFRFLISRIDPDKAIELQTLFDKYNRGEIAKHTFVPFMKVILGDQMLRSATAKVKQQKINLPVPVKTQVNSSEPVLPFDQLFPFLISRIDPDKAIEIEGFFDKYKRGELAKHTFESVMKCILGDQILRLATAKMKQQKVTNTGSSATSL